MSTVTIIASLAVLGALYNYLKYGHDSPVSGEDT